MSSKRTHVRRGKRPTLGCDRAHAALRTFVPVLFLSIVLAGISVPLWAENGGNGGFAYAANGSCSCGQPFPGSVSAYTIDATSGALTEIAGSPFAAGSGPHGVTIDPSGQFVYVVNELSNNVSAYTIDATSGALTAISGSPFAAGSAPHAVVVDPSGQFVYVANHDSNNVSAYAITWRGGAQGALTPISGSPFAAGTGPHGVTVDPTDRFVYVANHLSNNVSAYTITWRGRAQGALTPISGSPFAAGTAPHAVVVDLTGQFVYVANHDSNNVSAYAITWRGRAQGALTPISGSPFAAGTGPHGVAVDPTDQFLYVANHLSANISAYTITLWGRARGALTPISGSPFAGLSPLSVATTAGQNNR